MRPPIGAVIPRLPPGCTTIYAAGGTYYRYGDVYYHDTLTGYRVIDPAVVVATESHADVPDDFIPFWRDDKEYLYKDGQFFIRTENGLVWVDPPIGAITDELPDGSVSIWYQDTEYFESEGVFFQETPDGFMIVPTPWEGETGAESSG